MHELSICSGIVEAAAAAVNGFGPRAPRVQRVTVRVGRLTSVVPDSLRYHFELLVPGTILDGACLEIEEVPIRGRCADCGGRFEIETVSFSCPACGEGFVELISGRELELVSLDVTEETT
jgi:hydrogenase nickel incorporation protein HypA/HybF